MTALNIQKDSVEMLVNNIVMHKSDPQLALLLMWALGARSKNEFAFLFDKSVDKSFNDHFKQFEDEVANAGIQFKGNNEDKWVITGEQRNIIVHTIDQLYGDLLRQNFTKKVFNFDEDQRAVLFVLSRLLKSGSEKILGGHINEIFHLICPNSPKSFDAERFAQQYHLIYNWSGRSVSGSTKGEHVEFNPILRPVLEGINDYIDFSEYLGHFTSKFKK
jgi:hypothetical protein